MVSAKKIFGRGRFGRSFHAPSSSQAFALPTVLITSVVMLTVLLSALTAATSISAGLKNQYLNQIGRTAAQSGITMAQTCMNANGGNITWTDASPLRPNTDCTGTESITCSNTSSNNACYVLKSGNFRTTFKVGVMTDSEDNPTDIDVQGIVRQVRKTSGQVVYQTETSLKMKVNASLEGALASVGARNNIVSYSPSGGGDGSSSGGQGGLVVGVNPAATSLLATSGTYSCTNYSSYICIQATYTSDNGTSTYSCTNYNPSLCIQATYGGATSGTYSCTNYSSYICIQATYTSDNGTSTYSCTNYNARFCIQANYSGATSGTYSCTNYNSYLCTQANYSGAVSGTYSCTNYSSYICIQATYNTGSGGGGGGSSPESSTDLLCATTNEGEVWCAGKGTNTDLNDPTPAPMPGVGALYCFTGSGSSTSGTYAWTKVHEPVTTCDTNTVGSWTSSSYGDSAVASFRGSYLVNLSESLVGYSPSYGSSRTATMKGSFEEKNIAGSGNSSDGGMPSDSRILY